MTVIGALYESLEAYPMKTLLLARCCIYKALIVWLGGSMRFSCILSRGAAGCLAGW
jgi:hypothetical protein